MNNWEHQWLIVRRVTDPTGQIFEHALVYSGATSEDAANRMLADTALMEDWKVRNVKVVSLSEVEEWEVVASPAWKMGDKIR